MVPFLSLPLVALVTGVVLALVALLTLELLAVRRINSVMSPALEYARAKAEEEAEHILETARENARALIARAEAASATLTAERAKEDEAARHTHEEALKALRERFDTSLTEVVRSAEAEGEEARAALAKQVASLGEDARKGLKAASEEAAKTFADELTHALAEVRESLAQYEATRKSAVDAHIRELVAETTKIALGKSLPEQASAELVLRALNEARAAGAL